MSNIEKILQRGHVVIGALGDQFDRAIVGVTTEIEPKLVYSYNIMLTILLEEGQDYDTADGTLQGICSLRKDDIVVIHTVEHI